MTEIPERKQVEKADERPLSELAFREGDTDSWDRPEFNYQVADRLCELLGLTHHTDEIKAVASTESDRQKALFADRQRILRSEAEDAKLKERMGGVATKLVNALVPEDDPRDRDEITRAVLDALRPIDARLDLAEWDGVVGRP